MAAIDRYRGNLRSPVRGLWTGVISFDQFFDTYSRAITNGLTRAWNIGAAECGIAADELTSDEITARDTAILNERNRITPFALAIEEGDKASGGKLAPLFSRLELWVNRFLDIQNEAKILACGNEKLIWEIDPTKDNCKTCLRLNGKVKRANFWRERNIRPQDPPNENLVCGGWACGCGLNPTNKPVSRGPLPRLP